MVDLQSPQVQHTLQGEAQTHMELMKTGPGTCKNSLTFPIRPMSTGVYAFKRSSASNEVRYRFYFVQQLNCTLLTEQMVDVLGDTSGNINITRVSTILSARPSHFSHSVRQKPSAMQVELLRHHRRGTQSIWAYRDVTRHTVRVTRGWGRG